MSKYIRVTEEITMDCVREFLKALRDMRMTDGKVSYTKILGVQDRRATLFFTPSAWSKMQALVKDFDKEVAWHGVATRGEDPGRDEYIISDILVYPQEVTSSTVNTDQEEYEKWMQALPDEVFNNLRMQGHSHVNMGVTPSTVDTTHQSKILRQLDEDMFYIFVIWNKSNSCWVKIYDFAKNAMFDTADVDVRILGEDYDRDAFLKEAHDLVKDKVWTPNDRGNVTYYGAHGGYYGGGQGGGYAGYGGYYPPYATKPADTSKVQESEKKTEIGVKGKEAAAAAAADDGWRKSGTSAASAKEKANFGEEEGDDDDDFWSGRMYSDPFYARGY